MTVKTVLQSWANEAHMVCHADFDYEKRVVNIYTPRPGYYIGRGGAVYEKYNAQLKEVGWTFGKFIELQNPFIPRKLKA